MALKNGTVPKPQTALFFILFQEIQAERNKERLICDVIMDQEILPGVGNIIKNEALFDAGLEFN